MSWKATAYVKGLTHGPSGDKITRSEKFLLLIMADYHDEESGEAWPSRRTLARDALMSEQTVKSLRAALVRKGLLAVRQDVRKDGSNGSNRYSFPCMGAGQSLAPPPVEQLAPTRTVAIPLPVETPYLEPSYNHQRTVKPREKENGHDWKRYKRSDESNVDRPPGATVERWLVKEMSDHFGVKIVRKHLERCELFFVWRKIKQRVDDGHKGTLRQLMPEAQAEYQAEIDQIAPEPDATPYEAQTLAIYQDIEAKRQAEYAAEYAAWEQETYVAVNGAK